MPSVSKKQHNLMAMVANNPAKAKELGIPQKVGAEFTHADKGKTFKRGGDMAKANPFMEMIAKKKAAAGDKPMKKMTTKKMASGGLAAGHKSADGIATKGKTKAKQVTMKKGGYC
jgi:hypothetical protein